MKQVHFLAIFILLWALPRACPQAMVGTETPRIASNAGETATYTLPPDKLAKSKALYVQREVLSIAGTAYSLAVLVAMLFFRVIVRYRNWAESFSRKRFVQAFIVIPLFLLTTGMLQLPLDAYQHAVGLRYGLSVQGWTGWCMDVLKSEALTVVIGTLILSIVMVLIRMSPRRWWLYSWLAVMPIALFFVLIKPMLIDPMFDRFYPLEASHPALVEKIRTVVQRAGLSIPKDRMFEMKASEKVTELNAYVTGFGPSKRVVVWDTTLQKLSEPETLFVFGHEMGHYVLHHIVYGLAAGGVGFLFALYLMHFSASWVVQRYGKKWQIRNLGDLAALPVLFLILGVLGFFASPIINAASRHIEHQADIYGLEVTHGVSPNARDAAVHAFQVLGETSLDYPYPGKFMVLWFYNHPAIADRMRFAHDYDPWGKNGPKYVK